MSWDSLNNYELQAVRRLLCLDVSEAAQLIGKVSKRTWQYWESGRSKVPEDVETEMYTLVSQRNQIIDFFTKEVGIYSDFGVIRWYHTYEDFLSDYPKSNKILWRLHQSVCAFFFTEGGEVSLDANIELDKNGYIYRWFSVENENPTDEQPQVME